MIKTGDKSNAVPDSVSTTNRTVDEVGLNPSFILQFGSYQTIERTVTALSRYKKRGIETHWSRVDLGEKGIWYRLFTGPFETKEKAIKYKNNHRLNKSIVVFTPWTVLVAESAVQQNIDKIRSELRDNQIDNYAIKNTDGSYRLLSGAFVTKEGAEKLAQEIAGLGYDAKVVLR